MRKNHLVSRLTYLLQSQLLENLSKLLTILQYIRLALLGRDPRASLPCANHLSHLFI